MVIVNNGHHALLAKRETYSDLIGLINMINPENLTLLNVIDFFFILLSIYFTVIKHKFKTLRLVMVFVVVIQLLNDWLTYFSIY